MFAILLFDMHTLLLAFRMDASCCLSSIATSQATHLRMNPCGIANRSELNLKLIGFGTNSSPVPL